MGFQHRSSVIFAPQECPITCSMQNELETDGKKGDEMGEQLADLAMVQVRENDGLNSHIELASTFSNGST